MIAVCSAVCGGAYCRRAMWNKQALSYTLGSGSFRSCSVWVALDALNSMQQTWDSPDGAQSGCSNVMPLPLQKGLVGLGDGSHRAL